MEKTSIDIMAITKYTLTVGSGAMQVAASKPRQSGNTATV